MASFTVGASGDYTTMAAWESARQGTVDATEECVVLDNAVTFAGVTLSGWTSYQTVALTIRGTTTQNGDPHSGPGLYVGGGQATIGVEAPESITFEDLSFETDAGGFYNRVICTDGNYGAREIYRTFRRCTWAGFDQIGDSAFSDEANNNQVSGSNGVTVLAENCVFVDCVDTFVMASYDGGPRIHGSMTLRGCTFNNANLTTFNDVAASVYTVTAEGCLFSSNYSTNDDLVITGSAGTVTTVSIDNITVDSGATHNANWGTVTNVTGSVTFVTGTPASGQVGFTDISTDDFSLVDHANNIAIDYATNATMPSDDILGTSRSSPDAGAYEVATAGGSSGSGSGAITTIGASGSAAPTATATASVAVSTIGATGAATATDTATGSAALSTIAAAGTAAHIDTATGTAALSVLAATGTATTTATATGSPAISPLAASGAAGVGEGSASGSAAIATLTATGAATTTATSTASGAISALAASGNVEATVLCTGQAAISVLAASGSAEALDPSSAAGVGVISVIGASGSSHYRTIVYGSLSTPVTLSPGDEWVAVLTGPAADAPMVRVAITMEPA